MSTAAGSPNWTPEERKVLIEEVDKLAHDMANDAELAKQFTAMIRLAGLPDTHDTRKAIVLGGVLNTIGNEP